MFVTPLARNAAIKSIEHHLQAQTAHAERTLTLHTLFLMSGFFGLHASRQFTHLEFVLQQTGNEKKNQ